MSDDDYYWNSSEQAVFDFGDLDNTTICPVTSSKFLTESDIPEVSRVDEHMNHSSVIQRKVYLNSKGLDTVRLREDILVCNPKEIKENYEVTTPEQTITNIVLGTKYCLEQHKTKEEKMSLLDFAIKSNDGNAIIAAVMFLKATLRNTIFHHEILHRPEAVNQYLYYLHLDCKHDELANMLLMLGKLEAAAIMKYKTSNEVKHPVSKIKKLENCLNTHFQETSVTPMFVDALSEHICLLHRQLPIEHDDARQEQGASAQMLKSNARKLPLFDTSVISTLFYCCLYHYNLSENHLASPTAIKKQHKLTDKQFMWTVISALSQVQNWGEIENLFHNKSWLGSTRMKCCIGFNKVFSVLAKTHAPNEVLLKYIKLVEDVDERLNLAKNYKSHHLVLETLLYMRDRQGLLSYISELSPKSREYMEVEDALNSSNTKWKN